MNVKRQGRDSAMRFEGSENTEGFSPISIESIQTSELILAVKIKGAFNLSKDESKYYLLGERDDSNLKSRTLGEWKTSEANNRKIKYVIGINAGAGNFVVSAYEIAGWVRGGNSRTAFFSNSKSEDVLKELGLFQKRIVDLNFGTGAAIAYIN
ncbi:MAG: hypothetical protein LBS91_08055 [Clostridiales Family XIII bacterium]|jgi:hypothetical protein|nr:hypothetical protein [Clostridiales Family XIII bacterium]